MNEKATFKIKDNAIEYTPPAPAITTMDREAATKHLETLKIQAQSEDWGYNQATEQAQIHATKRDSLLAEIDEFDVVLRQLV